MFLVLISHLKHKEIIIISLFPARFYKNYLSVLCFFSLSWFTGATFTDWFTSYVNNVVSGGFPIIRDQIFRYISLRAFWIGIIVISKNLQLQIMRYSFPGRLITEPFINVNLFYSHFKTKTCEQPIFFLS